MPKRRHRVIIDTNLWISYLLSKGLRKLDSVLVRREIILLFSQELLDELVDVTQRPKFTKYFQPENVSSLLYLLSLRAELIPVVSEVDDCRDDKDNFLLALAKDGNATHLITGDKDLLVLDNYLHTKILTIEAYLRSL